MKVAHIVPIPHLEEFVLPSTGIHLVIAPLILEDKRYREFYRKRGEEGDFIIVDPGTYEYPENVISIDVVIEAAEAIKASEIILPDCYMDTEETLRRMNEYIGKAGDSKFRVMGVPQGRTFLQYVTCLRSMLDQEGIGTIGFAFGPVEASFELLRRTIPITSPGRYRQFCLRPGALDMLRWPFRLLDKHSLGRDVQFHCLGLGGNPRELKELDKLGFIRSCDTSAAFVYAIGSLALNDKRFVGKWDRPNNFFHYVLDSSRKPYVRENIEIMNRWAKSAPLGIVRSCHTSKR